MINYIPSFRTLYKIAEQFSNNYGYTITESFGYEGMGNGMITMKSSTLPEVRINIERYICTFEIDVGAAYCPLRYIKKYLSPDIILHGNDVYRSKRYFKEYFLHDNESYYEAYLKEKENFSYSKYQEFYKKFPVWVWSWEDRKLLWTKKKYMELPL